VWTKATSSARGKKMTKSIYIHTDERIEALKALEMVVESLRGASVDPYRWKWAIVAMQNAIQALIVTTISGTAGIGALRPEIAKKFLEAYESGTGNLSEEMKIDWFPGLYERMKKEFLYAPGLSIDDSVNKVNKFRNVFVHFPQQSWSLEANGLPRIFKDCLEVVNCLIGKIGEVTACDVDLIRRLTNIHIMAVKLVEDIQSMYNPQGGFF
jgi:hypothetical protein